MLARTLLTLTAVAVGLPTIDASPAYAQDPDCGTECEACGISGYEGTDFDEDGSYNMRCFNNISYCVACPPGGVEMIGDHTTEAAQIVELIQSAAARNLGDVLGGYRDRLLLSPTRNLVVVQGNGCDPDALASVVFVTRERIRALEALGLRVLEDYLK